MTSLVAYALVCAVALGASLLTFFTGFGLGTLLLPAFLLFFEPGIAVGLTAVVHLLNGLFKLLLVGRAADLRVAAVFGVPAFLAALLGARLLVALSELPPVFAYAIGGHAREITAVKLALAGLMLLFAALELSGRWRRAAFPARYLPLGGLLTGFFGGLSGHQGALRSAFLVRSGLSKEAFIATGVVIALVIDLSRLTVYARATDAVGVGEHAPLLAAATAAAFAGAFAGSRLLHKVTIAGLQRAVAALLAVVALGLAAGLV